MTSVKRSFGYVIWQQEIEIWEGDLSSERYYISEWGSCQISTSQAAIPRLGWVSWRKSRASSITFICWPPSFSWCFSYWLAFLVSSHIDPHPTRELYLIARIMFTLPSLMPWWCWSSFLHIVLAMKLPNGRDLLGHGESPLGNQPVSICILLKPWSVACGCLHLRPRLCRWRATWRPWAYMSYCISFVQGCLSTLRWTR